jgi:hypothetical protein
VGVIPRSPVLGSQEGVDLGSSWRDRAFSHAVGSIMKIGSKLANTVPVDGGSMVSSAGVVFKELS